MTSPLHASAQAAPSQPHDSVRVVTIGHAIVYNGDWVNPPFMWEMAYAWVEKCTGHRGDFRRVHFGVADSMTVSGVEAIGMWTIDDAGNHIIVYARAFLPVDQDLVVHEMIHDTSNGQAGEWPTPIGQRESPEFKKCLPSQRTP